MSTTTTRDIFTPFPYTLPTDWRKQKTFLEDTIALKGSRIKSPEHIGGWFIKAGLTNDDRDANLARQTATFQWLIDNISIYAAKNIPGGCEIGNPTANKAIARSLIDAFAQCAIRCSNNILDRERTFIFLTLTNDATPNEKLNQIRTAANAEYTIYTAVTRQNAGSIVDGAGRFNWTNVRKAKTDKALVDLIVKWFGTDPNVSEAVYRTRFIENTKPTDSNVSEAVINLAQAFNTKATATTTPKPTPTPKTVKTLDAAMTAFDVIAAAPSKQETTKTPEPPTDFHEAIHQLTEHYRNLLTEAGLTGTTTTYPILVTAGPIYFIQDEFRYDTTYESHKGPPNTIRLDQLTIEQADRFQWHLEAFDVAFTKYVDENTHRKAQAQLAKGIMSFLQAKKKKV